MDDLWTVLLLSLAMLVGCYLAGLLPLAFTFSEEKLKLVTVLGAGLLVGTSLAVIIPEAVHNMYSSRAEAHHEHSHDQEKPPAKGDNPAELPQGEAEHAHHHDHPMIETHTAIGIALVFGFIFMLLIDQIGGGSHSHTPIVTDTETPAQPAVQNRNKITATLGLVVHAAADGVALGAAVTTAEAHVTVIVFLAIMLHKAPAAFGLTSFLLHEGFDRPRIRKHLGAFACAAPFLAIATYITLSTQNKEALSELNATGIAMLFSAGTFLYVATVHVLPEITNRSSSKSSTGEEKSGFSKTELAAFVLGAVIPVLLSLGHSH